MKVRKLELTNCDYAFSVVMAVCNTADYLREAVDSLIRQSIGFEYVQLILVDDGSTDGSASICDEYRAKFPENIEVIHQFNSGVSAARNAGMQLVRGKYVNFLDSDDKLSWNTLGEVWRFFEMHGDETDAVTIPMYYFDGKTGAHLQNRKFARGERVVDLLTEWNIQLILAPSFFFKKDCLKNKQFDGRLAYAEDYCFVTKVLLDKCHLGLVNDGCYWYRKRNDNNSAMDSARRNPKYYLNVLYHFLQELQNYAKDKMGEVPLFIQHNLMYEIGWRIQHGEVPDGVLNEEDENIYRQGLWQIVSSIEDQVIMEAEDVKAEYKQFALAKKYGKLPDMVTDRNRAFLYYGGQLMQELTGIPVELRYMTITTGVLGIECGFKLQADMAPKSELVLKVNDREFDGKIVDSWTELRSLGESVALQRIIKYEIPLKEESVNKIQFALRWQGRTFDMHNLRACALFPLTRELLYADCQLGCHQAYFNGQTIVINPSGVRSRSYGGVRKLMEMLIRMPRLSVKVIAARTLSCVQRMLGQKPAAILLADREITRETLEQVIRKIRQAEPAEKLMVLGWNGENIEGMIKAPARGSMQYKLLYLNSCRFYAQRRYADELNPFTRYGVFAELMSKKEFVPIFRDGEICKREKAENEKEAQGIIKYALSAIFAFIGRIKEAIRVRAERVLLKVARRMPQKYILFESMPPYADNTRAVYDYIVEKGLFKNYKLVWLVGSKKEKQNGFRSIVTGKQGWAKTWHNLIRMRTKAIIYCNQKQVKLRQDQMVINLCHGSSLKSVHGNYTMPKDLDYMLLQAEMFEGPTRYEHRVNDNTVTAALGYPRNDDFFRSAAVERSELFEQSFEKLIIWYPTFRQHKNKRRICSSITLPIIHDAQAAAIINECARRNNVLIVLKPHFAQDMSYIKQENLSNLVFIDDSFFVKKKLRPYQFLHLSDALITDFSSVYYDYLLQDKPIALTWEDFEEYKAVNSFALDTNVYCAGGHKVYTIDEMCRFIERIAQGEEDPLREEREKIRRLTNANADGACTPQVVEWISRIIEACPNKVR